MLNIRMRSQMICDPQFDDPAAVVEWMGAIQAQEIRMVKWAVGIRMRCPSLSAVNDALDSGRILRLHVMRPTWHLIPGKDIKWMAALSEKARIAGGASYTKKFGVGIDDYRRDRDILGTILQGRPLTLREITEEFARRDIKLEERTVHFYLNFAEAEGFVCSGPEKAGKHTFALVSERVPDPVTLSREEALAELARRYFRSHGPASLEDFVWWSDLGVREARSAVASLGREIVTGAYGGRELLVHTSSPGGQGTGSGEKTVKFMPPYDEYLISYKNRLDCIKEIHTQHAYNNFGIFQPVILHNGRITGNWRKTSKKGIYEATFFPGCRPAPVKLVEQAGKEFSRFLEN